MKGRTGRIALAVAAALGAGGARAQDQNQDQDGMEVFPAVDPHTGGAPEILQRLGYLSFGPFHWMKGDSTVAVAEKLGGVPILWVETEHFCIGSTLNTYKIPGDREEKARLADELERLERRLGKLKAAKRELDPWLRLHLFAQRAEELYAAFHDDFGLEPSDYEAVGPYLGQPQKFRLLLCERRSEYGRFISSYAGAQLSDTCQRVGTGETGLGCAINVEALRELWPDATAVPFDAMLACYSVSGLANQLVDGYLRSDYRSPEWLVAAYGHLCSRRIDPRFTSGAGYEEGQQVGEDDHEWEGRVLNLARNRFFASAESMFAWEDFAELKQRDHLVAWSKLQYLLTAAQGDRGAFLAAVCRPDPAAAALPARQAAALAEHFQLTPEELDAAWLRWVTKTYSKR